VAHIRRYLGQIEDHPARAFPSACQDLQSLMTACASDPAFMKRFQTTYADLFDKTSPFQNQLTREKHPHITPQKSKSQGMSL
jgi:hypothetical protein